MMPLVSVLRFLPSLDSLMFCFLKTGTFLRLKDVFPVANEEMSQVEGAVGKRGSGGQEGSLGFFKCPMLWIFGGISCSPLDTVLVCNQVRLQPSSIAVFHEEVKDLENIQGTPGIIGVIRSAAAAAAEAVVAVAAEAAEVGVRFAVESGNPTRNTTRNTRCATQKWRKKLRKGSISLVESSFRTFPWLSWPHTKGTPVSSILIDSPGSPVSQRKV